MDEGCWLHRQLEEGEVLLGKEVVVDVDFTAGCGEGDDVLRRMPGNVIHITEVIARDNALGLGLPDQHLALLVC